MEIQQVLIPEQIPTTVVVINFFNRKNKKILLTDNGVLIRKRILNFKIALESPVIIDILVIDCCNEKKITPGVYKQANLSR